MPLCLSENVMMHHIICERASPPTYTWSEAFESFFSFKPCISHSQPARLSEPSGNRKRKHDGPDSVLGPAILVLESSDLLVVAGWDRQPP